MKLTSYKKSSKNSTPRKMHDGGETKGEICTSCKICMVGQLGVKHKMYPTILTDLHLDASPISSTHLHQMRFY